VVKGNNAAVAETIENNVRSKIIKEHLNDPAYYDKMSTLLDEIIASRKRKAIKYEEYLRRITELASQVQSGKSSKTPKELDTSGKRALFNNLKIKNDTIASPSCDPQDSENTLELVMKIDETIKHVRQDNWRGNISKESIIKKALDKILNDDGTVERIFHIIKQHEEY
jgi:type I restriction enzyme R subunit